MSAALPYILMFPMWWYVDRSQWWWTFASRTLLLVSDKVSIGPQFAALFAPYHNDRTAVGRGLGFLFRATMVLGGSVVLLVLLLTLLGSYVFWLLWPVALLLGFFSGGWHIFFGFLISLSALALYWFEFALQPKHQLSELIAAEAEVTPSNIQAEDLREYARGTARTILRDLPPSLSTGVVMRTMAEDVLVQRLFKRMDLTDQQVLSRISQLSAKQSQVISRPILLEAAINEGLRLHHRFLTTIDLFLGLAQTSQIIQQILTDLGIHVSELEQASAWVTDESSSRESWKWWQDEHFHRLGGVDRGWTSGWTPTMRRISTDVTAQVAMGAVPYIIGRDKEIQQVTRILERSTKNNVLLLGEPGVGKSSIVAGIAQAILQAKTTPALAESKVIELDLQALLASAGSGDQFEAQLRAAMSELTAGKTILFIDAIEQLVGQSGSGTIDATASLQPFIESGAVKVIGATDLAAYHRLVEPHATFAEHFQAVAVEEPDAETATVILQEFAPAIEAEQKVTISLPAIRAAVELSQKYIHDRVLPEKAIDLLDEVAVYAAHQKQNTVGADDVAAVVAEKTGIPVTNVTADEATKLQNLEKLLHERIVGQDEAVDAVANALRRSRAGLRDDHKPMAVFLFIGPTGVGKTELAKTIAQNYFGSEDAMIRLDMSEFQDPSAVNKLIGSPPGSADFSSGGRLTNAVRDNPFTVVLLDELEKAHPQILDLFLQVFDDGRLTDSAGRTVSFNQTIIIATSNAGARSIQTAIKQGYTTNQIAPAVKEMLSQKYFRPEFLNRFDDIVVFRSLNLEETMKVVKMMLDHVASEVGQKDIHLTASDDIIKKLAEVGYDPLYGARPLRHMIQDKVENMLAKKILSGELKRGAEIELNSQTLPL